jgi:ABC-type transporter Mla MlaB component
MHFPGQQPMLRIINNRETGRQKWTLCGQLAGPWVTELKVQWERQHAELPQGMTTVDLSDVTFIDEAGEDLLREMRNQGVTFVARGVETRHLLDNLTRRDKRELRRFLGQSGERGCF